MRIAEHGNAVARLRGLCDGLLEGSPCDGHCVVVAPLSMPPVFRTLLDHTDHMTEVLKTHYERPVELNVLQERREGRTYSRKILLMRAGTRQVVEFGIVRIDLDRTDAAVRAEILARRTPLGEILIRRNVLRRIEPRWFFRFDAPCPLLDFFKPDEVKTAYGRLGTIHCDGEPAIELVEVVSAARATD